MILPDASVWIDHLARPNEVLARAFELKSVAAHPFVVGELSLGSLKNRRAYLAGLNDLPRAPVATIAEVAALIEWHQLYSRGIGYVDVHLLASARMMPGSRLWTRDNRLHTQAKRLGVAYV